MSYAVIRGGVVASVHTDENEAQKASEYREGVVVLWQYRPLPHARRRGSKGLQRQLRNGENRMYRASLHAEKAGVTDHEKRNNTQQKIDEISKRG